MLTDKEIETMKSRLATEIEKLDTRLNNACGWFEFNVVREERIRKMAQYNILLEVLK